MFNHKHYVPVFKWKMGEYQALSRLSDPVKDGLTPLLEIPPVGFDHENQMDRESVDDHLGDFARRLKSKWQGRRCFVDLSLLHPATRMEGGDHCVDVVFADARDEGCATIPVVALSSDRMFIRAVAAVVRTDRRGVCLRVKAADFDRSDLTSDIEGLLRALGVGWAEADLVIDFETPSYVPMAAFTRTMLAMLSMVPMLNWWRTLTVVGTSYPPSVAQIAPPFQTVPRHEWLAYKAIVKSLGSEARIPTFGDYGVAHPDLVDLDPRIIKPFAKLRYTIDDAWHIGRGTPVRTHGFGQYRKMCKELMAQSYFDGAAFCAGDAYIEDCANGNAPTGNLSTWVWVATNRHLSKVVSDLASLHGLSAAA